MQRDSGPVLALTLRHDRLDSFWFTLIHEVEHFIQGHSGSRLEDLDEEAGDDTQELEADRTAAERLVPGPALARFVATVAPYYSQASIVTFASTLECHPSIVIGRLQHDGHVSQAHLRRTIPTVRRWLDPWVDTVGPPAPDRQSVTVAEPLSPGYAAEEAAEQVLAFLRNHSGWHGRTAILRGSRLPSTSWHAAIRSLMASGCVERSGSRRGTRYRAKG